MKTLFGLITAVAIGLGTHTAQADVITFDSVPEGTIAANQFGGVVFCWASVLSQGSILNPAFPPVSNPNVVYNYLNGVVTLDFSIGGITSVGAFVTGNTSVTESIFGGSTLLGTVSTGGANFVGAGTGLLPNIFLNFAGADITRVVLLTHSS